MSLGNEALWYKDAIIYEVPIRAFADSDGDGIGDFRGLTEKLDYLQDLGITAIWLLPFFPSPLRDDGYDVADYTTVNSIYGTLEDFENFIAESHRRNIHVIIELVINHTSDQHPWFQRSRRSPQGSIERDFYVWSDTPSKYKEARIIFQDFETSNWAWDPVAQSYYWHRFYSHQPDLNFDNPQVRIAVFEMLDFWLEKGVDGLRIDAVPYLYEREGTNCENLPETHAFLKELRKHLDEKFPNRMLLAEANQWPEDAVEYYGMGDECHMDFHFPLMPRLYMSLHMEDSFPIMDILQQTPRIPDNCQWAIFLRNHDELTLEMVSDEDRDYMYRVYAQDPQARINLGIRRRLAPLLGNNRRKIELMNALLLSLPGTPVIYYGDEIGMGDNIYLGDRNGVRTPMQWSNDRNAGFSRANPQRLYAPVIVDPEYHYESVNAESQRVNASSLWWWMKRILAVRKHHKAFGRGTFTFLHPDNRKVLSFVRTYDGEHILVVANLSRFVQTVELDLSPFYGMTPVEIFGRTPFPPITQANYFLSLGPHNFYWFTLEKQTLPLLLSLPQRSIPSLTYRGEWTELLYQKEQRTKIERMLPQYLSHQRWFTGKEHLIQYVSIKEIIPLDSHNKTFLLLLIEVEYQEGNPEKYFLPLGYTQGVYVDGYIQTENIRIPLEAILANVDNDGSLGVLFEGLWDRDFLEIPLGSFLVKRSFKGGVGEIVTIPTLVLASLLPRTEDCWEPSLLKAEQSNSSIVYGDRLVFKFYRNVGEGINPDLEIGRYLTERAILTDQNQHFVRLGGHLEYRKKGVEPITLGILMEFLPDVQDAWKYALDSLRLYFERVMAKQPEIVDIDIPGSSLIDATYHLTIPVFTYELIGSFLGALELLGKRTAEMHIALAANVEDPAFAPEPFTSFYQRSIYQYMRNLTGQNMILLRKRLDKVPDYFHPLAHQVLASQERILDLFSTMLNQKITAMRTRCHGDYHLKQVLYTGKDFVIIDFEGEPTRPLSERRMKRSPLRDVAGMLHSLYQASRQALCNERDCGILQSENLSTMQHYTDYCTYWTSVCFLQSYLQIAQGTSFLPQSPQEFQILLLAYLMEKAIFELGRELNASMYNLDVPLYRIIQILEMPSISYLHQGENL